VIRPEPHSGEESCSDRTRHAESLRVPEPGDDSRTDRTRLAESLRVAAPADNPDAESLAGR
jgi:hypothetical protein